MNPAEKLCADCDTPFEAHIPPENFLLICTTPRTGGHALAAALWAQGWGMPLEYFNPDFMISLQQRWINSNVQNFAAAKENLKSYGQHLMEKRSSSNLLSIKLIPEHVTTFEAAFTTAQFARNYIHMTRRDKVAQTISLAAMLLTRRAFESDFELKYIPKIRSLDNQQMLKFYNWILASEEFWRGHVSNLPESQVVHLEWEDFQSSPKRVLASIGEKFSLRFSEEKIESLNEPYQTDAQLKMELKEKFGDYLKTLVARTSDQASKLV
jgi:LPS sulfotransferase NodH